MSILRNANVACLHSLLSPCYTGVWGGGGGGGGGREEAGAAYWVEGAGTERGRLRLCSCRGSSVLGCLLGGPHILIYACRMWMF